MTRRVVEGFARKNLVTQHRVRYILPQFLTFTLRICIPFQVFLSCTLVAPKYIKRPAYVKNSRLLLLLMSCVATSFGRRKLATPILSVLSRVLRNSFRMAV